MGPAMKATTRRVGRPTRHDIKQAPQDENARLDRREIIVSAAATLFAEKGYDRTSIRDIGAAAGILSGSLYYYFSSKEEIFVEVHSAGMRRLIAAAREAVAGEGDAWNCLERLAAAHCRVLLEDTGFMIMVFPKFPEGIDPFRPELVRQRDEYERIFAEVIARLDLPDDLNRDIFRLQILGALNWSQTWFHSGRGATPEEIGRHLVRMLRR